MSLVSVQVRRMKLHWALCWSSRCVPGVRSHDELHLLSVLLPELQSASCCCSLWPLLRPLPPLPLRHGPSEGPRAAAAALPVPLPPPRTLQRVRVSFWAGVHPEEERARASEGQVCEPGLRQTEGAPAGTERRQTSQQGGDAEGRHQVHQVSAGPGGDGRRWTQLTSWTRLWTTAGGTNTSNVLLDWNWERTTWCESITQTTNISWDCQSSPYELSLIIIIKLQQQNLLWLLTMKLNTFMLTLAS